MVDLERRLEAVHRLGLRAEHSAGVVGEHVDPRIRGTETARGAVTPPPPQCVDYRTGTHALRFSTERNCCRAGLVLNGLGRDLSVRVSTLSCEAG
ncbi:hypothetical protein GCM10009779_44000 [Polymorphospora rubra]